jgi:hypothetical protein
MKIKIIIGMTTMLFTVSTFSQEQSINLLPRDANGKVTYGEIVQTDSISKDALYLRAKGFFVNYFISANDVIQMDDPEKGVIIGKGFKELIIKGTAIRDGGFIILDFYSPVQMWFTVKIQCKDGRYKYDIYDIIFVGNNISSSGTLFTAEYIFNENRLMKQGSKDNVLRARDGVNTYIIKFISDLKKSLSERPILDKF